jgi:hypothetical protein
MPQAATTTVRGTVKALTTAPMGEKDGIMLEDGTWLHWPPHLEDQFADIGRTGDELEAVGRRETGPRGDSHFEVRSVTNLRTNAKVENPDFAGGPPALPPDLRRAAPAPDREQRLRDLQAQVDRLQSELDRLRREK